MVGNGQAQHQSVRMQKRHPRIVIIREPDDLGLTFCQLQRFLHWLHLEVLHLPCIGFTSRAGISSSSEPLSHCVNFWEVFMWCLTCSAPAPSSPLLSVISRIWLPGPFTISWQSRDWPWFWRTLLRSSWGRWFIRDSVDFYDPRGVRQADRSLIYDCYFPSSFVFLPRLMALGSFFKLLF